MNVLPIVVFLRLRAWLRHHRCACGEWAWSGGWCDRCSAVLAQWLGRPSGAAERSES